MQTYLRTREQRERNAIVTGILATVVLHVIALVVCLTSGFTYLDPPPPERTSLVITFEDELEPEKPLPAKVGREPQAEEVDPEKPVELVQKAESPHVNDRPNTTPQTRPDPHGDVEVPTPPVKEPKLDPRASFPGMSKTDDNATTPHSASEKPSYSAQLAGTVVVQIKVDQYGNVTEAIPGAEGTTVTDKNLWNAARNAALKAHFNQSADAPPVQMGTITYIFKLQ